MVHCFLPTFKKNNNNPTWSCSFDHKIQQDMAPCRTSHGTQADRYMNHQPGYTCHRGTGSFAHSVDPKASPCTGSVPRTGRMVNCYSYTGVHSSSQSSQGCTSIALSSHHRLNWCCSSSCCCTEDPRSQDSMCIFLFLGHTCPSGKDKHSRI